MSKVEHLERQVKDLSPEELARFRRWFIDFDGQAWDRQLQADVDSGKLDTLAEKALRAHCRSNDRALKHFATADFWAC